MSRSPKRPVPNRDRANPAASNLYPGHEERVQAHELRVLRYFHSRPKAEGAQNVLDAVAREIQRARARQGRRTRQKAGDEPTTTTTTTPAHLLATGCTTTMLEGPKP
jgi:hypothetical protein